MDYESIWSGERGHYLLADGPSTSFAQRCVVEGESGEDGPRSGKGYRAPGNRFRDTVFAVVPLEGRVTLATVAGFLEAVDARDMEYISRALKTLVDEGRVCRERVKAGPGPARWVYWRP